MADEEIRTDQIEPPVTPTVLKTAVGVGIFFSSGVINRVAYKMTLVPMRPYIFFMAQLLSLVYMFFYLAILCMRCRTGKVTREMLGVPKKRIYLAGACESLASLLLLVCASRLPGIVLPILSQLILIWQLILSSILLRRKYMSLQIVGVMCVMLGSIMCSTAVSATSSAGQASIPYMLLMNVVYIFYALAFVTKEIVFTESKERLGGQNLDIFVVNTFGSLSQFLSTFLLLPFFLSVREMTFQDLPGYLEESISCFCGTSISSTANCAGAPLLPLSYIAANLALNISGLYLIRSAGALVTSLVALLHVPTTVAVFTLPLPYLGVGPRLTARFIIGAITLVAGLLIYSSRDILQLRQFGQSSKNA